MTQNDLGLKKTNTLRRRRGVRWALATVGLVVAGALGALPLLFETSTAKAAPPVSATPTAGLTTASLEARFTTQIKPLLAQHCNSCHADGKHKGDFSLDPYKTLLSVQSGREKWDHISELVKAKVMPPEGKKEMTPAEISTLTTWVHDAVNFCDCSNGADSGRVAIHRLNRTEYNNTVRDLLGVDFKPAKDFPADDTGYGFDNIADVLTMSPLLAEKYLAAAEQIMEAVIPTDNPFKTKTTPYREPDFKATGDANAGTLVGTGDTSITHNFIADANYEIRVTGAQRKVGKENAKVQVKLAGRDVGTAELTTGRDAPTTVTLKVAAKRGDQKISFSLTNPAAVENKKDKNRKATRTAIIDRVEIVGPIGAAAPPPSSDYRKIFIAMPGQAGLTEDAAARMVLQRFVSRAYRRPAQADEVESLLRLFKSARADGETYERSIRLCLTGVLVSPQFLFRIEIDPPEAIASAANPKPYLISDYELASRISYFLWSSTPDEELMGAAGAKKLRDPAVLEKQVRRMLADPRANALVENFAGQWLELRNLADYKPDPKFYPNFDDELRAAMKKETELFFNNIMREDRSVLELLTGDYTFMNERLAKHYGFKNVSGPDFRRVSLVGTKRAGFLTQASVLTVTAMPTRTSPVKRGKFVLENVLGVPPPPPPADVAPLSESTADVSKATLKVRLEQHRADPNCAVCHIRMDSIGFSLENFDAIGQWRDKDGTFAIDASGKMPEGDTLNGPDGLRRMLLQRQNDFVTTMIRKMLTYGTGRGLEHYDQCNVKAIEQTIRKDNYKFSSLVLAVIKSEAFQKRRLLRPEEIQIRNEKSLELQEKK